MPIQKPAGCDIQDRYVCAEWRLRNSRGKALPSSGGTGSRLKNKRMMFNVNRILRKPATPESDWFEAGMTVRMNVMLSGVVNRPNHNPKRINSPARITIARFAQGPANAMTADRFG